MWRHDPALPYRLGCRGSLWRRKLVSFATFITNFADQAVLLPATIAVGIGFGLSGWRRGALAWSGVIACTWIVIFLLKLACLACSPLIIEGLRSPSGHTAAAATAIGGFFGLIIRRFGGDWRWTIPISAGLAVVIGMSRLALHVHTGIDVVVAGVVGVVGAGALVVLTGPPPAGLRLSPVISTLAVLILLLHGSQMPAEAAIRHFSALRIWSELRIDGLPWQNCRVRIDQTVIESPKPVLLVVKQT